MNQARTSSISSLERGKLTASWLALAGIVGPFFFVGVFTVVGLLRPSYSPLHQTISDLGVGPNGWLMDGGIIITGLLLVAFAVDVALSLRPGWRWLIMVLFALHGFGLALAGIFTEAPRTLPFHILFATIGLFSPVVAFLVLGLALLRSVQWRAWGIAFLVASLATLVLLFVMGWVFTPGTPLAPMRLGGLMERVVLIEIEVWYVALGWRLFTLAGSSAQAQKDERSEQ